MTRTGKSRRLLNGEPEPFVELHPADAARARIRDGELARVRSRRGSAVMRARIVESLPEGVAFAPFHWGSLHAPPGASALNATTIRASDPTSRQPELKACAARIEPAGAGRLEPGPQLAHGRRAGGHRTPANGRPPRHRRLVVVGSGMAGLATVEAALERRDPGEWRVTMIGREPDPPYNRIMLSRLLARGGAGSVELRPQQWYRRNEIELRCGVEAEVVDPDRRVVHLATGERIGYDALVLATGSRPLMPPIEGIDRDGILAFRTLGDAREIAARARRARRAVVIGGGLLGLEAARGLVELGVKVTVVHLLDRLMETQLDGPAARLLARRMRRLGAEILFDRVTTRVLGNGRAEGLRFADGEEIEADLIVVATGIRSNTDLAERSGIEVGRAVLVDDELRTSAPAVWAVGECAEHRGTVYGLWAPLLEQARVAGATLAGEPAAFHGVIPATTLKVGGVDLFCAGRPSAEDDEDNEVVVSDDRADEYRKLVIRDVVWPGRSCSGISA